MVTAASGDTVIASFAPSGQLRFGRALPIIDAEVTGIDGCGALVVASTLPSFNPGCGLVIPLPHHVGVPNTAIARFAP